MVCDMAGDCLTFSRQLAQVQGSLIYRKNRPTDTLLRLDALKQAGNFFKHFLLLKFIIIRVVGPMQIPILGKRSVS
jgi:hypothetical protein